MDTRGSSPRVTDDGWINVRHVLICNAGNSFLHDVTAVTCREVTAVLLAWITGADQGAVAGEHQRLSLFLPCRLAHGETEFIKHFQSSTFAVQHRKTVL